jgi:hypothetical protein
MSETLPRGAIVSICYQAEKFENLKKNPKMVISFCLYTFTTPVKNYLSKV